MKKILFKALPFTIVVVITMGSACKQKEDEVPLPSISITDSVDADFESVTLHCSVSGNVSAEQLIVEYSKDQSLSGASKKSADKSGNGFTITIDGLEVQTTYFYRYTVENKISSLSDKNVRQFKTRDFSAPQVTTVGVTDLSGQSATLVGRIEYACGKPIIEQGFYFGRSKDALTFMLSAPESFSYTIDTLAFETRYYFQAYAKNEIGVGKGDIVEFTTLTGIPELETSSVSNISIHTATLNGELKHDGGCPVIELGFCYSESEAPSVSSSKITVEGAIGQFSQDISDLKPATKYYVRTYCINSKGTHYGNEVSFVTNPIEVTSIKLNKTSLLLLKGLSETLIATVEPDDASDKTIHWSSSDESIATVDDKGLVYAANKGSAYIYAKAGEKIDSCAVTVEKVYFKPEVVDLGLSVKWASFNLGTIAK